jgi:hypothetical protein
MGAWGQGPFDNDSALDWCNELERADPSQRSGMVRAALVKAVGEVGYLDYDFGAEAVAAAAIVASQMPTGEPITSSMVPEFLRSGTLPVFNEDVAELAIAALDRVLGDQSEWRALWGEGGATEFPAMNRLRAVFVDR